jgi:hypothetical protein
MQVRSWIEQWQMSLDDVELGLPEPLEEIDPTSTPANPKALWKPHGVRAYALAMTCSSAGARHRQQPPGYARRQGVRMIRHARRQTVSPSCGWACHNPSIAKNGPARSGVNAERGDQRRPIN